MSSVEKDSSALHEYAVQIKYNQPSSMQMIIKNNVLQISDHNQLYFDENYKSTRTVGPKAMAYPYTALLSKHVRSINDRPMFYFEVKFVG
jgi:hypothetical protein